jgi:hypothetical protein
MSSSDQLGGGSHTKVPPLGRPWLMATDVLADSPDAPPVAWRQVVARFGDLAVVVIYAELRWDAPAEVVDAATVQLLASVTGHCPACGSQIERPNRQTCRDAARTGRPLMAALRHEDDCPAVQERLEALIHDWVNAA